MSWDNSFTSNARKELKKLGHEPASKIISYLDEKIIEHNNPREFGKALKGELKEYWRYGVGNYRILCDIIDNHCIVLVVKVAHRRDAYD